MINDKNFYENLVGSIFFVFMIIGIFVFMNDIGFVLMNNIGFNKSKVVCADFYCLDYFTAD
jgi:hypothetical protein